MANDRNTFYFIVSNGVSGVNVNLSLIYSISLRKVNTVQLLAFALGATAVVNTVFTQLAAHVTLTATAAMEFCGNCLNSVK